MKYRTLVSMLATLFVLAGVLAEPVCAADAKELRGIYGGIGFGAGLFEEQERDDGTTAGDDLEDAWRLLVWWRAHEYASLEIGYIDAGDPDGPSDVDGLHLALVPTLPLPGNFDLFVKAGGWFLDDNEVAIGAGLAYHLPKGFGLRLDWDHLGVEDDREEDVDVVTLAVFYHLAK